jgi:cold shock CspA family protein
MNGGNGCGSAQRMQGIVTKFENGWGFAESSETRMHYLLGKRSLASSGLADVPLLIGEVVEFDVVPGGTPGKAEAVNIVRLDSASPTAAFGCVKGGPQGARNQPSAPYSTPMSIPGGERMQGTVTLIKGEPGREFAFAGEAGGDKGRILLGTKNLAAAGLIGGVLQVGDRVEFDLGNGAKGHEGLNICKIWA